MRRTFCAMIGLTLAVFAVPARADLFPKCRELMYTADVGECAECGGGTSSKMQESFAPMNKALYCKAATAMDRFLSEPPPPAAGDEKRDKK